ncbi:hypothetical protein G3574_04445 [Noviherbaspirillum sp. 17J57-3]|uniref:Peptidyl-prolyl cis-trans isomerase n=2 Tax=Noviherbaspirillum galbum TaxID=2709383 RepID=A0A6B3SHH2_9BURK|nr:hypothetical protein [Noviherbaspirillum galbum]
MKLRLALFLPVLLAACGGSGGDKSAIFEVHANNLAYGSTATLLFVGSFVAGQSLTPDTPTCTSGTGVYSTPTQYVLKCTVTATGDFPVTVKTSSGDVIYSKTLSVPAPRVTFSTSKGNIVAELYPDKAPNSVINFLRYVQFGFYSQTIFHRVIKDFVVQGGGFKPGLVPQDGQLAPIPLESNNGLSNARGTLAMARTTDPNSATSQFYFNLVDNTFLDYKDASNPGYAVFGKIVSGLDVVDAIGAVPTTTVQGAGDIPATDVVLNSVTRDQ